MRTVALVLAAGESVRMGRPKPLLEIGGETFLERILAELAQVKSLDFRLVVLGHRATAVRQSVHFQGATAFTFRGYRQGMLASLKAGARAALKRVPDLEALLVCHVDQPLIQAETYDALLIAFQQESDDVVVASYQGEPGHPVLLSRGFLEALLEDREKESLREFIEGRAEGRRYVDGDDPAVLQNVNTPEAYEALHEPEEAP